MTHDTNSTLLHNIQTGAIDGDLDNLLDAIQKRKAHLDKWKPINELLEWAHDIDHYASHSSPEVKARKGAEINTECKRFENDERHSPLVRGIARAVRQQALVNLLNVSESRVQDLDRQVAALTYPSAIQAQIDGLIDGSLVAVQRDAVRRDAGK